MRNEKNLFRRIKLLPPFRTPPSLETTQDNAKENGWNDLNDRIARDFEGIHAHLHEENIHVHSRIDEEITNLDQRVDHMWLKLEERLLETRNTFDEFRTDIEYSQEDNRVSIEEHRAKSNLFSSELDMVDQRIREVEQRTITSLSDLNQKIDKIEGRVSKQLDTLQELIRKMAT